LYFLPLQELLQSAVDVCLAEICSEQTCKLDICLYSAVHLARFASSGIQLFSGSDDKTVRLWDAATEAELQCFSDHQVIVAV